MSPKTAQIKFRYSLHQFDLSKLLNTLEEHLPLFFQESFTIWGTAEEDGPIIISHRLETLADGKEFVNRKIKSLDFWVNNTNGRALDIHVTDIEVRLGLDLNPEEVALAQEWEHKFSSAAGLIRKIERTYDRANLYKTERSYRYSRQSQSTGLLDIIEWFEKEIHGTPEFVRCSFEVAGERIEVPTIAEWKSEICARWSQVTRVRLWLDANASTISIDFDTLDDRLIVSIEKPTNKDAVQLLETLEVNFSLQRYTDETNNLVGQRRKFFLKQNSTPAWLELLISTLQERFTQKAYIVGRYTLKSSPTQESRREVLGEWRSEVLNYWALLSKVSIRFDQRGSKVDINLDILRDLVDIGVDAKNQSEIDGVFQYFEEKLGLTPILEEPYRYRRSSGRYEIQAWRNKNFAEAIEDVLKLFIGDKYDLTNAYIELGPEKNGEMQRFETIDAFLKRAGEAEPYANAEIYIQAPRGLDLDIYTSENHQKLWIGSSFEPKEFEQIEEPFKRKLKIKEIAETSAPQLPEKSKQQQLWGDIFKVLLTAMITFLLSSLFWTNIIPKHDVQITVPAVADGETKEFESSEIRLEWNLVKEQWFSSSIDTQSLATIRVLKDDQIPTQELRSQRPGVSISLDPGYYTIYVNSEQSDQKNTQKKIQIRISAPSNP